MGTEIERKFLVASDAWKCLVTTSRRLSQAYLQIEERQSIRVRIDGTSHASLAIKSAASGSARSEHEYEIPLQDAEELFRLRVGAPVHKVRHVIPAGPLKWEIDEFGGDNAGLVIAEIELPEEGYGVDIPAWVGKEVTNDPRYYNSYLALHPYSEWPQE
jgi:adenylate cyclase